MMASAVAEAVTDTTQEPVPPADVRQLIDAFDSREALTRVLEPV